MPLRPLPVPYKIGTDICHIPRVRGALLRNGPLGVGVPDGQPKAQSPSEPGQIQLRTAAFVPFRSLHPTVNVCLEAMNPHFNPRMLKRLFRSREILRLKYAYDRLLKAAQPVTPLYDTIAGRWAAKEAIMKAARQIYPSRRATWQDIFIWTPAGSPAPKAIVFDPSTSEATRSTICRILVTPEDFEPQLPDFDADLAEISISHDGEYATAVALMCASPQADGYSLTRDSRRTSVDVESAVEP